MIFSAIMLYIPPFIMDLTVHVATFSDDFRYKSSVQGFPGSPCLMTPELGSERGLPDLAPKIPCSKHRATRPGRWNHEGTVRGRKTTFKAENERTLFLYELICIAFQDIYNIRPRRIYRHTY